MKLYLQLLLLPAVLTALFSGAARATSASADSGNITVDTRGTGTLLVTGRVLNRTTGLALSGAAASLGGVSGTTAADGAFFLATSTGRY